MYVILYFYPPPPQKKRKIVEVIIQVPILYPRAPPLFDVSGTFSCVAQLPSGTNRRGQTCSSPTFRTSVPIWVVVKIRVAFGVPQILGAVLY